MLDLDHSFLNIFFMLLPNANYGSSFIWITSPPTLAKPLQDNILCCFLTVAVILSNRWLQIAGLFSIGSWERNQGTIHKIRLLILNAKSTFLFWIWSPHREMPSLSTEMSMYASMPTKLPMLIASLALQKFSLYVILCNAWLYITFLNISSCFCLMLKASYSASIIASIMQTRPTKMLTWQLINEERGN
jgi:hypothetical protein